MEMNSIKAVYFVGIGGIGMSAIARYFLHKGLVVGGYDKTPTDLTRKLEAEGALVHYEENVELIPLPCRDQTGCLVVYTPAIPDTHQELQYFKQQGFEIKKRAQVLGVLTQSYKGLCVAGTHGKTTTSSMAAHLLHQSHVDCNAFLGGITKNYGTNYILSAESEYVVIEADEFDRSFHWLTPYATVITATDADHLDIYGTKEAYLESFRKYTSLIRPDGFLILHEGLEMVPDVQEGVTTYTYSREQGDFHAENVRIGNGEIFFDLVSPIENIKDVQLGVPVSINIDNGIAAMALAQISGVSAEEIKVAMASFGGVDRRFDFQLKNDKVVFLTDYAHHPDELAATIAAVRTMPECRRLVFAFQPHTYTRTKALFEDFVRELKKPDLVVLAEIYAARERNTVGISSRDLLAQVPGSVYCETLPKVTAYLKEIAQPGDVILTVGAGDIFRAGEAMFR